MIFSLIKLNIENINNITRVAAATAIRTFSTIRDLETYLCNTTVEDRQIGVALLSVWREMNYNPNEVMRRFVLVPRI